MTTIEWMNSLGQQWLFFIKHAAWQAALLGLVVLFVVTVFSRLPSQVRYCLLVVALVKFVVPPMIVLPTGVFGLVTVTNPSLIEDSAVSHSLATIADHTDIKADRHEKDDSAHRELLGKSEPLSIDEPAEQPGMATLLQDVSDSSTSGAGPPADAGIAGNQEQLLSVVPGNGTSKQLGKQGIERLH